MNGPLSAYETKCPVQLSPIVPALPGLLPENPGRREVFLLKPLYIVTFSHGICYKIFYLLPTGAPCQTEQGTGMLASNTLFSFLLQVFVGPRSILRSHWYPLCRTSNDSAQEFQSKG